MTVSVSILNQASITFQLTETKQGIHIQWGKPTLNPQLNHAILYTLHAFIAISILRNLY